MTMEADRARDWEKEPSMHAGAIIRQTDSDLLVHNGGASHDPGRRRVGHSGWSVSSF